jgi:predicted DNA-binding protein (UPF0251 family)
VTPDQFSALASLIRMRGGQSQEAARLVLVEGMRPCDAARKVGLSPQGVNDAVRRVKNAAKVIEKVCGDGQDG